MADLAGDQAAAFPRAAAKAGSRPATPLPLSSQYVTVLLLVAGASLLAFVAGHIIAAPNLTLIYVLPVVIAGTAFGWGPSLVAALAGVLAFDFFFTRPYFSFRIYGASDIWAAALLLATAAIVTTVAAQARRRAVEALQAQERAEALQSLAHAVIQGRSQSEIFGAAATALHRLFRAPAVICLDADGGLQRVAEAGDPQLAPADEAAAAGALVSQLHTRGGTYPYGEAKFEFWPLRTPSGRRGVMGVDFTAAETERPEAPERYAELVAAYLAAALDAPRAAA